MKHLKYVVTSIILAVLMLCLVSCQGQGDFSLNFDFSSCTGCDTPIELPDTPTISPKPDGEELYAKEMNFLIKRNGYGYLPKIEAIIETQGLPEKLIFEICNNEMELSPINREVNVLKNRYTFTINEDLPKIERLYKGNQTAKIYGVFDGEKTLIYEKEINIDSDYNSVVGIDLQTGEHITFLDRELDWSEYV